MEERKERRGRGWETTQDGWKAARTNHKKPPLPPLHPPSTPPPPLTARQQLLRGLIQCQPAPESFLPSRKAATPRQGASSVSRPQRHRAARTNTSPRCPTSRPPSRRYWALNEARPSRPLMRSSFPIEQQSGLA